MLLRALRRGALSRPAASAAPPTAAPLALQRAAAARRALLRAAVGARGRGAPQLRAASAGAAEEPPVTAIPSPAEDWHWTEDDEEDWKEKCAEYPGLADGEIPDLDKARVVELFKRRSIEDRILENLALIDVRGRKEVAQATRLDIDIDQVFVVPFTEIENNMDEFTLHEWYTRYIFAKPRKDDNLIFYGKNRDDRRVLMAARLFKYKYGYQNVRTYLGGFEDYRGCTYEEWQDVRERRKAEKAEQDAKEKEAVERRRQEELEKYKKARESEQSRT
eukprot:TRINITY_DN52157_c0_g1_i1.p1 TRINITY_DN52157_c0_g1~~TRINITY_DN52157_c0_g1_i1.p1  ORF type:complete len:276 (+),score=128.33 TRINITY_DN52157_c0_g1_i1:73-900(+)